MNFKGLFKKDDINKEYKDRVSKGRIAEGDAPNVPDGLYTKCCSCGKMILSEDMYLNNNVCPKCGYYSRLDAHSRIAMVVDENSFEEWDVDIEEGNPCEFEGYNEKITGIKKHTGLDEAIVTGKALIEGREVVIGVCDTRFLMGSMGQVVGEKLTRAIENATRERLPLIVFTCSGGARMQEGIVSLMQMAKTSAAIKKHDETGCLYITVLTDPTTGGVTASFSMLGDIILAEPQALVGFAGPRVIKQTIGQELPKGFQRAEFLLEHGLIDNIVRREDLKSTLSKLLRMHQQPENNFMSEYKDYLEDIYSRRVDMDKEEADVSNDLGAWDKVQIARSSTRPTSLDYINYLTKDFYELHGDRRFKDDGAVIGGVAMFGKQPVTIIGHQKGTNTKDNIYRNFGMPNPEGYRKALRLMKQAEKFKRPVICLVDTPGAYCGIGAEERGQGEAIARNLYEMSDIKVPMLSIIIGEGGSGGALALAVTDEVWMMENAIYSVLSPEGFASILWKDAKRAKEAADVMKLTAKDLKELGIIERIIPEFPVVTGENISRVATYMKRKIAEFMLRYQALNPKELTEGRYKRFRRF